MSKPSAEETRVANLVDAQAKAQKLFGEVGARGVIAAGVTEVEASDAIRDMAAEMFGVSEHWHRRIVRAGPNTLEVFMRRTNRVGRRCHWILEVHLVDRERQIGGFHEQLLDVG